MAYSKAYNHICGLLRNFGIYKGLQLQHQGFDLSDNKQVRGPCHWFEGDLSKTEHSGGLCVQDPKKPG